MGKLLWLTIYSPEGPFRGNIVWEYPWTFRKEIMNSIFYKSNCASCVQFVRTFWGGKLLFFRFLSGLYPPPISNPWERMPIFWHHLASATSDS